MTTKPLQLQLNEATLGEPQEKINETIYTKDSRNPVGEIELYLIDADNDLKGYVDQYRGDHCYNWYPMDIFQSIEFDYDHCFIRGKVAYLSKIIINEESRGKGIGTDIMYELIAQLTRKGYDYIILQPSPLISTQEVIRLEESLEDKRARHRLYRFYSQFGFYRVPTKGELKYPIYYKDLRHSLDLKVI